MDTTPATQNAASTDPTGYEPPALTAIGTIEELTLDIEVDGQYTSKET